MIFPTNVQAQSGGIDEKAIPDYVNDGLIILYDGINNTGNGFSSSTNTWKNLVGNTGDLVLDSNGGIAPIKYSNLIYRTKTTDIDVSGILMLEIVMPLALIGSPRVIACCGNSSKIFTRLAGDIYQIKSGEKGYSISNHKVQTISIDYSNNKCYSNGVELTQGNTSDTWGNVVANAFSLCNYNNYNEDIQFCSVRAYTKVLSAEEMAHNLAIDIARWGIEVS